MMRAADTLAARVLLVSLLGISLLHVLSLWTYEQALDRELAQASNEQLADRVLSIKRSVATIPEPQREALAHGLSGGRIQAHWSRTRGAAPGGPGVEDWRGLTTAIERHLQSSAPGDLVIGTGADPHLALLSLRLPDDSWLNVNLFAIDRASASGSGHLSSTSLMAFGVALLSVMMATWLTRPLRQIAEAITKLSIEEGRAQIPETGPREVRHLAAAFNAMHGRLVELILKRTRSLAAVSHDLRTPLTRLKLRLGDVESENLQRAMAADIDEMEQMIDATLSYLKGRGTTERQRPIDLVALLETIIGDARDAGHDANLEAPAAAVIKAQHMGIKRALSNLVGNALRYAGEVRVRLEVMSGFAIITIDDSGPGIPDDKLEEVFEPFVRLEHSRNAETGGVGLGLTIAKANIEADGGTLVLRNRPEGGLSAIVRLPTVDVSAQV